jgi:hypothetical protein
MSCARVQTLPVPSAEPPVIQENLGEQVARHLTNRYADTRTNCGTDSRPAFLCAGIMIRGTSSNPTYHVWNNSAGAKEKGGVSFSYLRSDTDFRKLAYSYTNGFVFTSYEHAATKIHPEVLCSFPIDAGTDYRVDNGCGQFREFVGSGACHLRNILTAAQWWADYNSHPSSRHSWQCGFDVKDSRNALAGPAFAASVGARRHLGLEGYEEQNEVVVKTWADNLGKTLPLEAFFYIYQSTGLAVAQRNQRDLKATDGILIPIISVRLAPTQNGTATFYYIPSDQTEPMPPATAEAADASALSDSDSLVDGH